MSQPALENKLKTGSRRSVEVRFGERLTRKGEYLRSLVFSGPALLWIGLFLVLPLLAILVISFFSRGASGQIELPLTLENYQRFAGYGLLGFDPLYPLIILRSVMLGGATTVICLVLAFPMSLYIASLPARWKNSALTLVVIPLWTNLLIRTYAWQIMLAPDSWLATLAAHLGVVAVGEPLYPSHFAVYLGMVCDFLPFMVLPLYSSVEKLDWTIVEAAMDLGANKWQAIRHAIVPQVLPGAMAGAVLTFIPATGTFVIPDLLGGAKTVLLGNAIQQQFGPSRDLPFGSAVTMLAMFLVMVGLWFFYRLEARKGESAIL